MQKYPDTRNVLSTSALFLATAFCAASMAVALPVPELARAPTEIATPADYSTLACDSSVGDVCLKAHCPLCGGAYDATAGQTFAFTLSDDAVQAATGGYGHCTILDMNTFVTLSQPAVNDLSSLEWQNATNPLHVSLFTPFGSCGSSLNVTFNDEAATAANACPATGGIQIRSNDPLSDFDGDRVDSTWTLGLDNGGPSSGSVTDFGFIASLSCAIKPAAPASCTPSVNTACLNNNRFKVTMTYQAPAQAAANGHANSFTADTAWFWFFDSTNVEAVVKVLNGCGTNNRYWVFVGGLTNVRVVITVEDTQTHLTRTYINPQGTAFKPIQDTNAFATCP